MISEEKIAHLRLFRSENVGAITFRALLNHFGSSVTALENLPDFARRGGRSRPLKIASRSEAEKEIEQLSKIGAELIYLGDSDYPSLLAEIPDAPPVLTVMGKKALLQKKHIAIVGTRNASINGKNIARKMAADFVKSGYGVISGLALGIDAAAHEGALYAATSEISTIAVLGTGINVAYPQQNKKIYDEIKEKGLLVTEYIIDTKPQPSNFPCRNRIISGISSGLVVIEAALRSGSLITANKALEQGKDVFAVPASPFDSRASGVNHLIKTGAPLVESASDVIEHLTTLSFTSLREPRSELFDLPVKTNNFEHELSDQSRRNLLDQLDGTSTEIDTLIRETGLPAHVISVLLVELELAGQIDRLPGNKIIRKSSL